ncbi:HAD family hydrolase [Zhengella mangrovi]|uniref:HAD family hydrolase n=1 Tax=Zhengella mangrovi TaxID=1982044 RepID=A0A2G1QHM9_9HYPH|nr:HAD-IA family hydrolase [Zhengella mangrovi]PHP65025.1 HAD family hydrolase [Zhengella mangrovi]
MKLVLFDCDGTLVDSAGIIHGCMERTFAEAQLPVPTPEGTRGIIGLSLDIAIARLLAREVDDEIGGLVQRYKHHFVSMRAAPDFREDLYDGIAPLIASLALRDDILIGMVTGKSRRGVESVFQTHGFGQHFLTVRTADDCPSKPHPAMVLECCAETGMDPKDTLVVGDAIYDMQMAKAAGAVAIGVSWGYGAADELRRHGADAVLEHPSGLHDHL